MKLRSALLLAFSAVVLAGLAGLQYAEMRIANAEVIPFPGEGNGRGNMPPWNMLPIGAVPDAPPLWIRENVYNNLSMTQHFGTDRFFDSEYYHKELYEEDVLRVLAVGDSYTYGVGLLDPTASWHSRLEAELDKQLTRPVEVIPLSIYGASLMDQSEWLSDKLVATLRPDLIIVAHVGNDIYPSGNERMVCGGSPCRIPEISNPATFAGCLNGERFLAAWFLQRQLHRVFPYVAEKALTRYCQTKIIQDADYDYSESGPFESNPFLPLVMRGIDRFGEVDKSVPVMSVLLQDTQQGGNRPRQQFETELVKRGLTYAEMVATEQLLETTEEGELWANPADSHPGSRLTAAYVTDIISSIRKHFSQLLKDPSVDDGTEASFQDGSPLLDYWLPTNVHFYTHNDLGVSLRVGEVDLRLTDFLSKLQSVVKLPVQAAPCMALGAAHMRLTLKAGLPAGTKIAISRFDVPLTVFVAGYDRTGNSAMREIGTVAAGRTLQIELQEGDNALLLKPQGAPRCDDVEGVVLPDFEVTLSRA
jgi:hypothetical protein